MNIIIACLLWENSFIKKLSLSQGTVKVLHDASVRERNQAIYLWQYAITYGESKKVSDWFLMHRIEHRKTLFLTALCVPPITFNSLHFLS